MTTKSKAHNNGQLNPKDENEETESDGERTATTSTNKDNDAVPAANDEMISSHQYWCVRRLIAII